MIWIVAALIVALALTLATVLLAVGVNVRRPRSYTYQREIDLTGAKPKGRRAA